MREGKRSRKVEHVILGPFTNVIIESHFWNPFSTFASEPIINILIFIISCKHLNRYESKNQITAVNILINSPPAISGCVTHAFTLNYVESYRPPCSMPFLFDLRCNDTFP